MKKLYNILKILPEWAFLAIYLSSILLYCILIGLQGFDMTDEGWASTGFSQIYNDASTISGIFTIYNTLLVGGLFHLLLPSLGIIAFRIASALCLTAIAYIVYGLLKDVINRWYIFLGVGICIVNLRFIRVLHYDYTSALLVLIIALLIYQACIQRKTYKMLIAGILVGISFFFRLPNVCLCGMIAALIPFFLYTRSAKQTFTFLGYAVLGVIIGICVNVGLIYLLHHQEPFYDMLNIATSYLTQSDSTHNSAGMLNKYLLQIRDISLHAAVFLAFPLISVYLHKQETIKWLSITLQIILVSLFVWTFGGPWKNTISIFAFCTLALGYNVLSYYENEQKTYLSLLALLIMILLPLGSDGGILNVGSNAMYLALPLSIGVIFGHDTNISDKQYFSSYRKYSTVFLIYTIIIVLSATFMGACRDSGNRFLKTYQPTHTIMTTTYTSQEKAAQIDSLFVHLRPHITNITYLLAYPSIPAINYLANAKPYLTQPWIGIMDFNTYLIAFDNAQKEKPLPIIVVSKSNGEEWTSVNKNWNSILDCWDWHPSIKEKNEYLLRFVQESNYLVEWEDNCFQLLIPPTTSSSTSKKNYMQSEK